VRKSLVIANWKQNGDARLFSETANAIAADTLEQVDVAICAPFVYLQAGYDALNGSGILSGAQNCSAHAEGAYTGEVGAAMLKECGVNIALVGHSERRSLFGEQDSEVNAKILQLRAHGITPVLCIGETLEQREAGEVEQVIKSQLEKGCDNVKPDALVIAYEPVWAIGTGQTATPEQAQEVHKLIRSWFAGKFGTQAQSLKILYGGSMKPENAAELLQQPDIDGGLIGGASLKPEQFNAICRAAQDS